MVRLALCPAHVTAHTELPSERAPLEQLTLKKSHCGVIKLGETWGVAYGENGGV